MIINSESSKSIVFFNIVILITFLIFFSYINPLPIYKELSKFYPGTPITKKLIAENIEYHWPHIATEANTGLSNLKLRDLLKSARYYFIAPIVKQYVESGITSSVEIAKQIGTYDRIVVRAVKQEYQVSSWADFLAFCQAPLSYQSLIHLDPEEYKRVGGESLELYKNFVIDSYVIRGYEYKEMDDLIDEAYPGYTEKNLRKRYGGFREARKQLVAPILALCFKKGYSSKEIGQKVPFFEKRMPSSRTWKVISYWSFEWFGINPTQARAALRYRSLEDFLAEYLN